MKTIMWFVFVLGALSAAGKVFQTKPGLKVTIECGTISFSKSLVWRRENEQIWNIVPPRIPTKGKGDMAQRSRVVQETNLQISQVKKGDAGKFTCLADGKSYEHTLLVVSVSASPPGALQVGSKATLQCQVNGLDQVPEVQWKKPDGSQHTGSQLTHVTRSDGGTWCCTFSHGGETYNQELAIKVEEPPSTTHAPTPPQGQKDKSKPLCHNCGTDPPPGLTLLQLKWWVWVAVGVGCLVVVLLLVFVIVLCKRIRRRKRQILKMKNSRQLLKPKKFCECDHPTAAAKSQQGRRREKPSGLPLQPLLME